MSAAKEKGGRGILVAAAVMTLLAGGGGAAVGKMIAAKLAQRSAALAPADAKGAAPAVVALDETDMRELPAVVTNLADPPEARIRLQLAIVYPRKSIERPDVLATEIANDVVAYLKTMSVAQLQGASGLEALREDLTDRANTRSGGKVRELMIENFVIQ